MGSAGAHCGGRWARLGAVYGSVLVGYNTADEARRGSQEIQSAARVGVDMGASYHILASVARRLLACQARLQVSGTECIPGEGALLVVSNHLGMLDPYVIGARLPRALRILAKAEIFEWPVLGGLARWGDAVPVHRGDADRQALRTLAEALVAGQCVLVFPEGQYAYAPARAEMAPFKPGAGWLALRTGAPVVPVAIWGTERVWMRGRGWRPWQRPRVHVRFGAAYRPSPPHGLTPKAAYAWAVEEMALRIAALLPSQYQGFYAARLTPSRVAVG